MKKLIIFFCFSVVLLSACSKNGKTVATVGGDKITESMVQQRLDNIPAGYQDFINSEAGRKQFLDLMIRERVVLEAAKKSGFDKKADYVKSLKDFMTEQDKRVQDYKDTLLLRLFLTDLHQKDIGVTDAEVKDYYDNNKNSFEHPVEITARHILVTSRPQAEQVLARLKNGEDFSKLAKEFSTDPVSASKGGEIGPFKIGDLVPEFEKAVFALKIGKTSDIVQTQFGYHIIQKLKESPLPSKTMEQSGDEIKRIVEKIKFDKWIEQAKAKYNVNINYNVLNKIKFEEKKAPSGVPSMGQN
jgi:parvulin-like peptidyl-prolyl isomerase